LLCLFFLQTCDNLPQQTALGPCCGFPQPVSEQDADKNRNGSNNQQLHRLFLIPTSPNVRLSPVHFPPVVEIYAPERLAEFFLNNAMDREGYLKARKDVERRGIDPDRIDHIRWPD
jgi:hypothetical protein